MSPIDKVADTAFALGAEAMRMTAVGALMGAGMTDAARLVLNLPLAAPPSSPPADNHDSFGNPERPQT